MRLGEGPNFFSCVHKGGTSAQFPIQVDRGAEVFAYTKGKGRNLMMTAMMTAHPPQKISKG